MESVYTHQLNAYYCIVYPADNSDAILDLLNDTPYADLGGDAGSMMVRGKHELFSSLNSDVDEAAQYGFIAIDEMTFEGPKCDNLDDVVLRVEPRDMIKREDTYKAAVKCITDIYTLIITRCKENNISIKEINMGWHILSCMWDDGDSSSSEAVEVPKRIIKQSTPATRTKAATPAGPTAITEPTTTANINAHSAAKVPPKNKKGNKKQV